MFEFYGSDAPQTYADPSRCDVTWLLCNQAQWVMRGRNALLWWLEEEEAWLGNDCWRQSDLLAKSPGREGRRLDIWAQTLTASGCLDPRPPINKWIWALTQTWLWTGRNTCAQNHVRMQTHAYEQTYTQHQTSGKWRSVIEGGYRGLQAVFPPCKHTHTKSAWTLKMYVALL